MNKKAFIFPGQGAQYLGMGKDFFESFAIARETFEEASDVLSFDMKQLIFQGHADLLAQTKYSQPAIFTTSVAILKTVRQQFASLEPAICAGLSLGEYTALLASKRISFASCLKIVGARGAYMQEACEETPSTMRVVLGLAPDVVQAHLPSGVWIANLNCPGQVVIAGRTNIILEAEEALQAAGARRILALEVSGAFHTPLMRSAQLKLEPLLKAAKLEQSAIQLVMNVPGDFVHVLEEIRTNLIHQVASPTRWEQGIRNIEHADIELYIEMGPGKTLAGMNKKIGVKVPTISIEKVAELELIHEIAQR